MEGWVDLGGWLHTEMGYLPADMAWRRVTSLIGRNALPLCHATNSEKARFLKLLSLCPYDNSCVGCRGTELAASRFQKCSHNAAARFKETRSLAVARIADHTSYQWPSRSSKVDNFHFVLKGVCYFLLVISRNLGLIFHRFRDTAIYSLRLSIKNCGQTATDGHIVTTGSL